MKTSAHLHSALFLILTLGIGVLLFTQLVLACSKTPLVMSSPRGNPLGRGDTQDERTFSDEVEDSVAVENHPAVYVCGIGSIEGKGECLVVFADGKSLREIPLSGDLAGCNDADYHFLIGEDVYSCPVASGGTAICRNGQRLFFIPTREYVTDLLLRDGKVWTLSKKLSLDGFSLRCDGEEVLSSSGGTPLSEGLYEDSSKLYFSYSDSACGLNKIWLVEDGVASEQTVTIPDASLMDVIVRNGEKWSLVKTNKTIRIYKGDTLYSQYGFIRIGEILKQIQLFAAGDECAAVVTGYNWKLKTDRETILLGDEKYALKLDMDIYHYFGQRPQMHILTQDKVDNLLVREQGERNTEIVENAKILSKRCAMRCGSTLYIGCIPASGDGAPFVWRSGGGRMTIPLKGKLIAIWVSDS